MAASAREELVHTARISEAAARYDDMVDAMSELVSTLPVTTKLDAEERKLLATAYKNEILFRRKSLKVG